MSGRGNTSLRVRRSGTWHCFRFISVNLNWSAGSENCGTLSSKHGLGSIKNFFQSTVTESLLFSTAKCSHLGHIQLLMCALTWLHVVLLRRCTFCFRADVMQFNNRCAVNHFFLLWLWSLAWLQSACLTVCPSSSTSSGTERKSGRGEFLIVFTFFFCSTPWLGISVSTVLVWLL